MTSDIERLQTIILLAQKLGWIKKTPVIHSSYSLMELSEVEKCMIAMKDDSYFQQMKVWASDNK